MSTETERPGFPHERIVGLGETGKLWSFLRRVMMRGGDIRDLWRDDGYEAYVVQIEAAAVEEETRLLEMLRPEKCQSCQNGYDGRNGNGYQPCGCVKPNAQAQPTTCRSKAEAGRSAAAPCWA